MTRAPSESTESPGSSTTPAPSFPSIKGAVARGYPPAQMVWSSRADAVLARRGSKSAGLVFGTRRWDHFRTAWEGAVERAKLVDFHFHDLRHTFASWAVQRGASLQEVKDLLGHHSLAMALRYGHLAPEHLRTAVARLDTALPASDSAQASAHEVAHQVVLLQ